MSISILDLLPTDFFLMYCIAWTWPVLKSRVCRTEDRQEDGLELKQQHTWQAFQDSWNLQMSKVHIWVFGLCWWYFKLKQNFARNWWRFTITHIYKDSCFWISLLITAAPFFYLLLLGFGSHTLHVVICKWLLRACECEWESGAPVCSCWHHSNWMPPVTVSLSLTRRQQ